MSTLFHNCKIYPGPEQSMIDNGYLKTENGYITELAGGQPPETVQAETVIDCGGKLLMPGLINGHNHCAMTLFRGLADDLDLTTWLHDHIFPAEAAHVSPEMVYWCTRLAAAEMLLSGTTCVADAYFFSTESARALRDCGMRAVVGHGIVDFPAPSVPDPKKNIEAVRDFLDSWQGTSPLITPAVFAHAPYTCSPTTLQKAKELADSRGVRFFTHLSESRKEPSMIIDRRAPTPIGHLDALSTLDDNCILIHGVWFDDSDLDILSRRGAHVISCPQSNMKLASGIARVTEMLEFGIQVGLGTDGCASNNSMDMFREINLLAKLHKLTAGDATVLPAQQAIRMATSANSAILGLDRLGELNIGNRADLIVVDTNRPSLTPMYNSDLLAYGAGGGDVVSTMVAGELVMHERQLLSFDLQETVAHVMEIAEKINR